MKPSDPKPVSLGDIAKAAGVSRMSVSCALRNQPGIGQSTRDRILEIARELRYTPDPRVAMMMSQIRETKSKDLMPLAWINVADRLGIWRECDFLRPYYDGAAERCRESGYRLVEFQLNYTEMTSARLSQILYQRGIQGVIVAPPCTRSIIHLRLSWEHFAAVSFERALAAPRLHQAVQNTYFNILLSLKKITRAGYRRIGVILPAQSTRRSRHMSEAAVQSFHAGIPRAERIPPFVNWEADIPQDFFQWVMRYTPDAVLGGHSELCNRLRSFGLRVPEDVGVAHLSLEGDCDDWCGIRCNKWEIGAAAADLVISQIQNNQMGLPKCAREIVINGTWQNGKTLLVPKPPAVVSAYACLIKPTPTPVTRK
ncbi:MAG TPA: LacI family DNA-binding transcriptional regulator [Candidatus Methylacidiphilales bacterium]|nr:LacI family DNA-binding transcriptional regulator [Candidatus Methylacidiphilales bacterium]